MDSILRREIEELRRAPLAQIRARYREAFDEEPRSKHREHLWRRLAWRLQAASEGGLSEAALQRALAIANEADVRALPPRGFLTAAAPIIAVTSRGRWRLDRRIPPPGTILKRDYDGRSIVVKILADAFEHQGRRYGSLSAIASEVTGTRWNGLAFFGLTKARRAGGSHG